MFSLNKSETHIHHLPVSKWSSKDVAKWLAQKHLRQLSRIFLDNKVTGKVLLNEITSQYLDRLGILNPSYRDKLLTAVHELKLYGGPLPDNIRLSEKNDNLPKKRLLPVLSHGFPRIQNGDGSSKHEPGTTPQKMVKKAENALRALLSSQPEEKGQVNVYTPLFHSDVEYKTIDVTGSTTSKELACKVLAGCNTASKDPNLYYIAMETQSVKKDSSLPMSTMVLLEGDSRPLELQMCQPQGLTKFHLKMKNGGLVRVQANSLSPGVGYTSVHVARNTTATALIKMVLVNYGHGAESSENFLLRESSANLEVDRILDDRECPLQVQSEWKPEYQRSFHLTRRPREMRENKATPDDGLSKELEKRNAMILMLQESIRKLIRAKERERINAPKSNAERPQFEHAQSSYVSTSDGNLSGRHDIEAPMPTANKQSEMQEREKQLKLTEQTQQRRTSIDALHLEPVKAFEQSSASQIERFREYQRPTGSENHQTDEEIKQRKISLQIAGQLRNKFREYCDGHRGPTKPDEASAERELRSSSEENANPLDLPPTEGSLSRSSSLDSADKEMVSILQNSRTSGRNEDGKATPLENTRELNKEREADTQAQGSSCSLHAILENRTLITATLTRRDGETWGIELARVTETRGISGKRTKESRQESKVVYVVHHGNGRNAVVGDTEAGMNQQQAFHPITATNTPSSGSLSESTDSSSSTEELPLTPKEQFKTTPSQVHPNQPDLLHLDSSLSSRPLSASTGPSAVTFSLTPRPSSALAQWRKGGSPETRHGVWVVGVTDGVAAKDGQVHVDDLIVEVNGQHMLNASLDQVIQVLQGVNTINLVVARALAPELYELPSHAFEEKDNDVESFNGTDIGNLTEQVQTLAGKISELREEMKKKDRAISSYKKALAKNKRQNKEQISETMKVEV